MTNEMTNAFTTAVEDVCEITIQMTPKYSDIYAALHDSAEVRYLFVCLAEIFTNESYARNVKWGETHDWMLATEAYAQAAFTWLELRQFKHTGDQFQKGMKAIFENVLLVADENRESTGSNDTTPKLNADESMEAARLAQRLGAKPDHVVEHWHVPDFENPTMPMHNEIHLPCILCDEHYELQVGLAYDPTADEGWIEPSYVL